MILAKIRPSPRDATNADQRQPDNTPRWKKRLEIGAFVLACIGAATYWTQLHGMQDQLDVMHQQLEASEHPWLGIVKSEVVSYPWNQGYVDSLGLAVDLTPKNIGNIPAVKVGGYGTLHVPLITASLAHPELVRWQKEACREGRNRRHRFETVYPAQESTRPITLVPGDE